MDWSKIENIVFVTVAAALGVFFLVTFFLIVSKGKRKCKPLDVALRVFASVVMLVCAVLFVGALFTDLTGNTRINVTVDPAVLYLGGKATELPLTALFVTLSQKTGFEIIILEFFAAFIALSADCLLANKKSGKSKNKKQEQKVKTQEELKREAQLEKIRRLGDAAVKKSNAAAVSESKSTETPKADIDEDPASENEAADEDEGFDWRVDPEPQKNDEFIGLSESVAADDDFDSFDSEPSQSADEDIRIDYSPEEEIDDARDDAEPVSNDETPWYAQDGGTQYEEATAGESYAAEDMSYDNDGEYISEEGESGFDGLDYAVEDDTSVEPNRDIYIPKIRTVTRTERRKPAAKKNVVKRKKSGDAKQRAGYKPATNKTAEKPADKKPAAKKKNEKPAAKNTVAKNKDEQPDVKKPAAKKKVEKPMAKKPVAKKQSKPNTEKNTVENATVGDPKRLPVTRRYVILDRTSAVNIFSNYLKEREKEEKDKLESSISTIIIK